MAHEAPRDTFRATHIPTTRHAMLSHPHTGPVANASFPPACMLTRVAALLTEKGGMDQVGMSCEGGCDEVVMVRYVLAKKFLCCGNAGKARCISLLLPE